MEIEPGIDYLLDGKTKVVVIRPLNRAKTVFSVQLPEKGIDTVDRDRLKPVNDLEVKDKDIVSSEAPGTVN